MPFVYMRYELLRTLRNRRFFLLSLGFPLVLYFVIVSSQPPRAATSTGAASRSRCTTWSAWRRSGR